MARVPLLQAIERVAQHREVLIRTCLGLGRGGSFWRVNWSQALTGRHSAKTALATVPQCLDSNATNNNNSSNSAAQLGIMAGGFRTT